MSDVGIGIDSSQADRELDEFNAKTVQAVKSMITNIRRASQIGIYTAQAMGMAIDQTITLSVEAAMLTIELAFEVATLEAMTGIGLLRAGLMFVQIVLLLQTVQQLKQKRTESATKTGAVVQALRLLTY